MHHTPDPKTPDPKTPGADDAALARDMPKVLLHEHLDGGLRVSTLLELLHQRGLDSPAPDVASLGHWFETHAFAHSLVDYLKGFDLTEIGRASCRERV